MSTVRTVKHFRTEFPINRTKKRPRILWMQGRFFGFAGDPVCLLQNRRYVLEYRTPDVQFFTKVALMTVSAYCMMK